MNKHTWNTYDISGYTCDVANDQASAGGVRIHQVRQTRAGKWQRRILQSNGQHEAAGPTKPLSAAAGEALYARAKTY